MTTLLFFKRMRYILALLVTTPLIMLFYEHILWEGGSFGYSSFWDIPFQREILEFLDLVTMRTVFFIHKIFFSPEVSLQISGIIFFVLLCVIAMVSLFKLFSVKISFDFSLKLKNN